MFHPLDLIAPIGISLIAVVLCLWALIKNPPQLGAKIAAALCGLAFLAFTPAWYGIRCSARAADYTSNHGLRVRQGDQNRCYQLTVEKWTEDLMVFWEKNCPDARKSIKDKLVVCRDEEKIGVMGRWVRGYSTGSVAVVGWNGEIEYTKSLFRHEVSHIIALGACGKPYDEAIHHAYFKEVGLGN